MGWEDRNGRAYYYRKERAPGGRVRSVYVGAGRVAQLGAQLDAITRERRALERDALRASLAPFDAALAVLDADAARLRAWRDAAALASGRRRHRGQWRRPRGARPLPPPALLRSPAGGDASGTGAAAGDPLPQLTTARTPRTPAEGPAPMPRKKTAPEPLPVGGELHAGGCVVFTVPDVPEPVRARLAAALDADANAQGDLAKLAAAELVRRALDAFPAEAFGPLLGPGVLGLAGRLYPGTPAVQALATKEAERFAHELAAAADGPLVRAAVAHAAHAYLVFHATAARHAAQSSGASLAVAEHWERCLTRAQTRYLRALATVAALRRLAPASTPAGATPARLGDLLTGWGGDSSPADAELVELAPVPA